MQNQRPINLELATIRLPLTAAVSILHRISGVALFFAVGLVLYLLQGSLDKREGFIQIQALLAQPWTKALLILIISGLAYHLVAGVRHLLMDMGLGETLAGGVLGARLVLIAWLALTLAAGIWLW